MMDDSATHSDDKAAERDANDFAREKDLNNAMNEDGGDVLYGNRSTGDDEDDGPTSSVDNIIPMDKIKNGWFALSNYMTVSRANERSSLYSSVRYLTRTSSMIQH